MSFLLDGTDFLSSSSVQFVRKRGFVPSSFIRFQCVARGLLGRRQSPTDPPARILLVPASLAAFPTDDLVAIIVINTIYIFRYQKIERTFRIFCLETAQSHFRQHVRKSIRIKLSAHRPRLLSSPLYELAPYNMSYFRNYLPHRSYPYPDPRLPRSVISTRIRRCSKPPSLSKILFSHLYVGAHNSLRDTSFVIRLNSVNPPALRTSHDRTSLSLRIPDRVPTSPVYIQAICKASRAVRGPSLHWPDSRHRYKSINAEHNSTP